MDYTYYANTDRLDPGYDADRVLESVRSGSVVIAQPILNMGHPLNHQALRDASRNVIFAPYIFLDGLFSMSTADEAATRIYGEEPVIQLLRQADIGRAVEDFRSGRIDFNCAGRLAQSMEELMARERQYCDVAISDVVQEFLRKRLPLVTHNHPASFVFDVFCERIFAKMETPYIPFSKQSVGQMVEYVFSLQPRVLSPFDRELHQLSYEADEQWFNIGFSMIRKLNDRLKVNHRQTQS